MSSEVFLVPLCYIFCLLLLLYPRYVTALQISTVAKIRPAISQSMKMNHNHNIHNMLSHTYSLFKSIHHECHIENHVTVCIVAICQRPSQLVKDAGAACQKTQLINNGVALAVLQLVLVIRHSFNILKRLKLLLISR